jgi:hypothetical protein
MVAAETPVQTLDAEGAVRTGYTFAPIRLLADVIPDLISGGQTQERSRLFGFGTLQALFARDKKGNNVEFVPLDSLRSYFAGLRATALSTLDLRRSSAVLDAPVLGDIQRVAGLGDALRGVVLSASLSGKSERAQFFVYLLNRLEARAKALTERVDIRVPPSVAMDLNQAITSLDKTLDQAKLLELWRSSDIRDGRLEARGKAVGDSLFNALLNEVNKEAGKWTPDGYDVQARRYIDLDPDAAAADERQTCFLNLGLDDDSAIDRLASLYESEGELGSSECYGRGYATFLGLAHVLVDLARRANPRKPPKKGDSLWRVVFLWRAAIHGLLAPIGIDQERADQIYVTEGSEDSKRAFGEQIQQIGLVRENGELASSGVVGFLSAELGLIPHADWIESPVLPEELERSVQILEESLKVWNEEEDHRILVGWAAAVSSRLPEASKPAWAKLLMSLAEATGAQEFFKSHTIPGREIDLVLGSSSATIPIPYVVDRSALERILYRRALENSPANNALTVERGGTVYFEPFGDKMSWPLFRLASKNGTGRVVWIDHTKLADAKGALGPPPANYRHDLLDWSIV